MYFTRHQKKLIKALIGGAVISEVVSPVPLRRIERVTYYIGEDRILDNTYGFLFPLLVESSIKVNFGVDTTTNYKIDPSIKDLSRAEEILKKRDIEVFGESFVRRG